MKTAFSFLGFIFLAACAGVHKDVNASKVGADLTTGVPNICPIHHARMKKTPIPAMFGYLIHISRVPAFKEYEAAKRSLFPFGEDIYTSADESPTGSQIVGDEYVLAYVCNDCLAIGEAWRHRWRYGEGPLKEQELQNPKR